MTTIKGPTTFGKKMSDDDKEKLIDNLGFSRVKKVNSKVKKAKK